ncbi:MAG: hypothetical protein DLM60_21750 [Pseudonocardiales bacterium]|nr:MAG: hypothetical protein DLM60_21750 [Pseudonocardiales bacterium]
MSPGCAGLTGGNTKDAPAIKCAQRVQLSRSRALPDQNVVESSRTARPLVGSCPVTGYTSGGGR